MAETGAEGNFIAIFSSNDTDIQFYTDEYVQGMEVLDNMELDGKECKNTIINYASFPQILLMPDQSNQKRRLLTLHYSRQCLHQGGCRQQLHCRLRLDHRRRQ